MTTPIPFLYQTRTIQRLCARVPVLVSSRHLLRNLSHSSSRARKRTRPWHARNAPDSIPFELPDDVELPEETGADASADASRSTITPTERDAFDSIFQEIAARSKRRATSGADAFHREPTSVHPANIIIQDAIKGLPARQPPQPTDQIFTATDRAEALERFPPSLQRAAMVAFGLRDKADSEKKTTAEQRETKSEAGAEAEAENVPVSPRDQEVRQREQARVEARMRAAKTDFELWDVMEEEVFSMVDRLGIGEGQKAGKHKKKGGKRMLSMDVHGPLYPSHLLYGLQLLDQAFARPSALALSVLPRVKQLGLASYVLGAPASFYHALMGILWARHNDAGAVLGLWDEMHHAGLPHDQDCVRTLAAARKRLRGIADGEDGPFLREIASMAEHGAALEQRIRQAGFKPRIDE